MHMQQACHMALLSNVFVEPNVDACSGSFTFMGESGTLVSPGFEDGVIPMSRVCTWGIHVPDEKVCS